MGGNALGKSGGSRAPPPAMSSGVSPPTVGSLERPLAEGVQGRQVGLGGFSLQGRRWRAWGCGARAEAERSLGNGSSRLVKRTAVST